MVPVKVEAITKYDNPKIVNDVRGFLGLAYFYWRFIEGYALITIPVSTLIRTDVPWKWDEECQQAFNHNKERFTSAPILRRFDPNLQTVLETDGSDFTVSDILFSFQRKILHLVAFVSYKIDEAERN